MKILKNELGGGFPFNRSNQDCKLKFTIQINTGLNDLDSER